MTREKNTGETDYDVLVVGAGPTGITLATLLARHGRTVCVVERHTDPYPLPRAVHLDAEVYRILHELGVGEAFDDISRPILGLQLVDARRRVLARFERSLDAATGLPQANLFDQPNLERLLRENLTQQPTATVLGGHEVTRLTQTTEQATAVVRDLANDTHPGATRRLTARYVVGCDGANSLARRTIGATQRDLGFEQRWLVVDVRTPVELSAWDGVHQVCDPWRAATYMRIGRDRHRFELQLRDGESAADYADLTVLRPLIEPWIGDVADEQLEVLRAAPYTFRATVAERWRDRRILIAGDAAHLTPPFIGQGMCAGLRDAMNLAWKLTVALDGTTETYAANALLDSYQQERAPHVTSLIRLAVNIGRAMTGGGVAAALIRRATLALLRNLPAVGARILDTTSPALTGPLIDRALPRSVRGALLPLMRVGTDAVLVDRRLGNGFSVVSLPEVDLPQLDLPGGLPLLQLQVDAGCSVPGERELAVWLKSLGSTWALVRPDRTVHAIGTDPCRLPQILAPWSRGSTRSSGASRDQAPDHSPNELTGGRA